MFSGIRKFARQLSSPQSALANKAINPAGGRRKRPAVAVTGSKVAQPIAIKKRPGNPQTPRSNVPSPLKILAAAGLTLTPQPVRPADEENAIDVDCITLE
jgi:hypothetical protein